MIEQDYPTCTRTCCDILAGHLLADAGHDTRRLHGDRSFGTQMADIMCLVATDVTGGVIAKSGHWVMEEQPKKTTAAIIDFIEK